MVTANVQCEHCDHTFEVEAIVTVRYDTSDRNVVFVNTSIPDAEIQRVTADYATHLDAVHPDAPR